NGAPTLLVPRRSSRFPTKHSSVGPRCFASTAANQNHHVVPLALGGPHHRISIFGSIRPERNGYWLSDAHGGNIQNLRTATRHDKRDPRQGGTTNTGESAPTDD